MKSIVEPVVESIREVSTALGASSGVSPPAPHVLLIMLFIGLVVLSTTYSLVVIITSLVSSLVLLVAYTLRARSWWVLRVLLYTAIIALAISAPLVLMGRIGDVFVFVLRVVAASSLSLAVVVVSGWRSILRGLEKLGVPRLVVDSLELTVYFVPIFSREILNILVARRARHVDNPGFLDNLRLGSTIVGELLARVFRRLELVVLAYSARKVGDRRSHNTRSLASTSTSLTPYLPLVLEVIALVVSWLG